MKQIIIIGGGFAGINAARALKGASVHILLLDRTNHHLFQPLLYQVATAALSAENIASPIREILRAQKNAEVLMEEVVVIDRIGKQVTCADGASFSYDYLLVAPGARHAYFGHEEWEQWAPGLKTLADADRVRDHILMAFEEAERCRDPQHAQELLHFAIIGAGPTGVELAGSLAEFAHRTLFKNFHHINPATSKIYLIEAADQVLPGFPLSLSQRVHRDLLSLGVDVRLGTAVTQVSAHGVTLGNEFLAAPHIIWAAGNRASPLLSTLDVPLDRQGRAIVNADLTVPGDPFVFVLGDAAHCMDAQGKPLPAIAPVAIQQGHYVAELIKQDIRVEERQPFVYFDKGTVATVGRGRAVAMVRSWQFSGLLAWFVWCFVHIFYLVSFRHKILVLFQWMFLYLFGRRQGRVITHSIEEALNNRSPDQ